MIHHNGQVDLNTLIDLLLVPVRPISKAWAKRLREAMSGLLVKDTWAKQVTLGKDKNASPIIIDIIYDEDGAL